MTTVMQWSLPLGNCQIHSEIAAPSATLHGNGVDKQLSPWAALYPDSLHTQCTSAPTCHDKEESFTYICSNIYLKPLIILRQKMQTFFREHKLEVIKFLLKVGLLLNKLELQVSHCEKHLLHQKVTYMVLKLWAMKALISFESSLKLNYIFCQLYILHISHLKVLYSI